MVARSSWPGVSSSARARLWASDRAIGWPGLQASLPLVHLRLLRSLVVPALGVPFRRVGVRRALRPPGPLRVSRRRSSSRSSAALRPGARPALVVSAGVLPARDLEFGRSGAIAARLSGVVTLGHRLALALLGGSPCWFFAVVGPWFGRSCQADRLFPQGPRALLAGDPK